VKEATFMVNAARAASAPLGAPMSCGASVPEPGTMAAVFANFRQYLMGWDTAHSCVSDLDLFAADSSPRSSTV
jgi:hypothetical protein